MDESIAAYPVSGLKTHNIDIQNKIPFRGGNEQKQLIQGSLGRKDVSMVERIYDPYSKELEEYVNNWKAFKSAGLPVVPTIRKTDNNSLLVTNVKADGSEVYGKGLLVSFQDPQESRDMPHPEVDSQFIRITGEDGLKQIEDRVKQYCNTANTSLIRLPYDDPFELIIHPNGEWELMTLDLRYGKVFNAETSSPIPIQEAQERNIEASDRFIQSLKCIRSELIKRQKTGIIKRIIEAIKR